MGGAPAATSRPGPPAALGPWRLMPYTATIGSVRHHFADLRGCVVFEFRAGQAAPVSLAQQPRELAGGELVREADRRADVAEQETVDHGLNNGL